MAVPPVLSGAEFDTRFKIMGEFIEATNRFEGLYSAFDTDISEIETELNTESQLRLYDGVPTMWESFRQDILKWIGLNNQKIASMLTDKQFMLDLLKLGDDSGIQTVLAALIADMNEGSESCTASTVTVGSVSSELDNTEAGTLLVDKGLDGATAPDTGMQPNKEYDGVDSQLAKDDDTLRIICISDRSTGQAEHNETFKINGGPSVNPFSHLTNGAGSGPAIKSVHSYSLLSGLALETFTTNVPEGWTITSGAAGTEVLEESTQFYKGSKSLELAGTSTDATLELSSDIANGTFTPRKRYIVTAYVHADTLVAGAGSKLEIRFAGSGYTAASSEKISLDASALNALTGFTLQSFYINMPVEIPSDWNLEISLENATAGLVWVDYMAVAPVTYFNGVNFALVHGSDPFVAGDEFQVQIQNNNNGVFQTFFRKAFGVQMPTSGSPTIDDAWAT